MRDGRERISSEGEGGGRPHLRCANAGLRRRPVGAVHGSRIQWVGLEAAQLGRIGWTGGPGQVEGALLAMVYYLYLLCSVCDMNTGRTTFV
jgi:hypothetical protein